MDIRQAVDFAVFDGFVADEEWCREVVRIYRQDWTPAQRETGTVAELAAAVNLARKQVDPESEEFVTQGKRTDLEERPSNTRKSNGSVDKPGILRRLARERPDLLDRVEVGESAPGIAGPE